MDSDEFSLRSTNRHTNWTPHSWSKCSFCSFSLLLLSWVRQKNTLKNRTFCSHYSSWFLSLLSTHKTRWVVIADRLGVAKCLHCWIRFNDLVFQRPLHTQPAQCHQRKKELADGLWRQPHDADEITHALFYRFPQSCDNGKVLDDPLGVNRLPCTRLSTNTHTHISIKWPYVWKLRKQQSFFSWLCYVDSTLCLMWLLCVYCLSPRCPFLLLSSWYLSEKKTTTLD